MVQGTTIWVDDETRAELRRLQRAFSDPSANATIRRLLSQPAMGAHAIFAKHRKAIAAILQRYQMSGLVAFGSRARGDARPESDLDLAVHVDARSDPLAILSAEIDFEALLDLKVHLVELPNKRLDAAIRREGVPFAA